MNDKYHLTRDGISAINNTETFAKMPIRAAKTLLMMYVMTVSPELAKTTAERLKGADIDETIAIRDEYIDRLILDNLDCFE